MSFKTELTNLSSSAFINYAERSNQNAWRAIGSDSLRGHAVMRMITDKLKFPFIKIAELIECIVKALLHFFGTCFSKHCSLRKGCFFTTLAFSQSLMLFFYLPYLCISLPYGMYFALTRPREYSFNCSCKSELTLKILNNEPSLFKQADQLLGARLVEYACRLTPISILHKMNNTSS